MRLMEALPDAGYLGLGGSVTIIQFPNEVTIATRIVSSVLVSV
jgi:hypothetical protein